MRVAEFIFSELWDYMFDGTNGDHKEAYAQIEGEYTRGFRHYHNLDHIEEGVLYLYTHKGWTDGVIGQSMKYTSILAFFFHDFVNPRNEDAELESALAMREFVIDWTPEPSEHFIKIDGMTTRAYYAICATKDHISDSVIGQMVVDADLMRFIEGDWRVWADQLRKEYAEHPDEAFNAGRRIVLERFRSRSPFFYFVQHRDCDAYRQIDEQLAELTS